jgi:hypothetical protein
VGGRGCLAKGRRRRSLGRDMDSKLWRKYLYIKNIKFRIFFFFMTEKIDKIDFSLIKKKPLTRHDFEDNF